MDKIDIEEQADWLKQIKLSSLSNRALTLASKLSRGIRKHNGIVVKLQSDSIALDLAEQVVSIDDQELNDLFRLFLEEAIKIDDSGYQPSSDKPKKKEVTYRGIKVEN